MYICNNCDICKLYVHGCDQITLLLKGYGLLIFTEQRFHTNIFPYDSPFTPFSGSSKLCNTLISEMIFIFFFNQILCLIG